jgi:hypothetical protein
MPGNPGVSSEKLADPEWRRSRASRAGRARTTPEYHLAHVREIVRQTRAAQGLPPVIVEDLTIGRVAEMFRVIAKLEETAT